MDLPLPFSICAPYIIYVGLPTMTINAHVISGLDPGAVPGGSTTSGSPFILYRMRGRF